MSTEYCRHIRTSGTRCRSYALKGQLRCFWHTGLQARHRALNAPPLDGPPEYGDIDPNLVPEGHYAPRLFQLNLPDLEDRASIQLAISIVLGAMSHHRIDTKRANALLYGLQVAGANVRGLAEETYIVRSSTTDENGQPIAPDEDPEEIIEAELFREDYEADQKRADEDDDYESKYDDDE